MPVAGSGATEDARGAGVRWAGPAPADVRAREWRWDQMGQSPCAARPSPQAILPLMKFLEVELCYMNTNLVQENFSRSAAAACPAVPTTSPPAALLSWLQHPFSGEDAPSFCLTAHSQGQGAHHLTLGWADTCLSFLP